ncbi:chaperonin [Siphonobacter sp. BAB-5385]|uniref:co-chaperone GroES n=1 Tax=unclassified Siphonobacter TaxID=2635712 RepID=UPI000B9E5AE1|nr:MULTISPECIES: co-chaperone GroES family protein [unclassified Siphonobacter]OZI10037.1 chaperonin [Siphonobacter sp. BAB-5385]PMD99175.1 chaperonin [Siphonobacter sp. BAB-5405]
MSTLEGIHTLRKLIMAGDKVLVRPSDGQQKTRSGLYLPPTVTEKEDIQQGVVIKVGPGFPIPAASDLDEPWKEKKEDVKYVPLQVRENDQILFLRRNAFDVEIDGEKYLIIPHSAILLMVREDELSELGL